LTTLAAIDVGSNAMRLAIGKTRKNGKVKVIETAREPVRLGWDAFSQGRFSPEIVDRTVEAFRRFSESIRKSGVQQTAAVATSAVREAQNGLELTHRVRQETGIDVSVITGVEEARLVHLAVSKKLDISKGDALLVDIGGGSVELAITSGGLLVESRSYDLGTVRMLHVLSGEDGAGRFAGLVEEVASEARDWISGVLGHHLIGVFIGTGGNVETIGDLSGRRAGKLATSYAYLGDIDRTRLELEALGFEGRRRELGLKQDRADVIYPATVVIQSLMNVVWAATLTIPRVGLREGVLVDLSMRWRPGRRLSKQERRRVGAAA
jgi:exopolyphosphatase/guanosine-5'-triphosphate,3'-diphosphate pyrophosphatase